MNSVIFARVVEPEVIVTENYGTVFKFGLIVGRECSEHSIYQFQIDYKSGERKNNPLFRKVVGEKLNPRFKDGQLVCAVVAHAVTKDGKLGTYVRDMVPAPAEVKEAVNALFR